MWSAACGQAAEDLGSFSLPCRRREAPLELRVLARPLLEVRRAGPRALLGVGLERVLLAGVLWGYGWVCGVWWAALAACGVRVERKLSESFGRSRGVTFDIFFVVGRDRPLPREQPFQCSASVRRASRPRNQGVGWF